MPTLRIANLALKFLLELGAIAAFAYWGTTAAHGALSALLAIVAPAVTIVLWGVFAAPKSERRLPRTTRVLFELSVFGLAAVALFAAGSHVAAVVFGAAVAVNSALLSVLRQWEH